MLFADVLYPKEVLGVMGAVMQGQWDGPNPEKVIDQMIYDFVMRIPDKKKYESQVLQAVKELGCLDCVLARLNLECLLEQDQGDTIVIRRGRVGRLPGEFGGMFSHLPEIVLKDPETKAIAADSPEMRPSWEGATPIEYKPKSDPQAEAMGPPLGGGVLKRLSPEVVAPETGPDGEPVFEYPDDQATLDEIERTFYAEEEVVKKTAPAPQLSPEKKIEVREQLRSMNYEVSETRDEAFNRLEGLLKRRSYEQSIVGRLAFLIIFQMFRQVNPIQCLLGISPRGMLPAGFGK